MWRLLAVAVLLLTGTTVRAQNYDPPPAKAPDAATLKKIEEQTAKLREAVAQASAKVPKHEADLAVYVKAAEWIVRHQEWFTADSGKQTLAVIEQGLKRAETAMDGKTPWLEVEGRSIARGYRSKIDGSVQPYGVVFPHGYLGTPGKKWRLDIHLHGRDSSLTEVKHLYQHAGKQTAKEQDFVQINIYGRGNNAYRWAGEEDVDEVIEHFLHWEARVHGARTTDEWLIDPHRVVLKGFSMGGAGTWQLGLRTPGAFAALQPGAGFVTTHGYIARLPDPLPDYQEKCLRIYDAYRYAENAFNVPIVAYSGELDKQRQAATIMEDELKRLKLRDRMTHLIGPGLEHKFPPEWQQKAEVELQRFVGQGKGRAEFPPRVRFVTYTLKQPECHWIRLLGLEHHYERAAVDGHWDGESAQVATVNVRRLRLTGPGRKFPGVVTIDGQRVDATKTDRGSCDFDKVGGKWRPMMSDDASLFRGKRAGVQGPIDDAFTRPFLCVVGTGTPYHPELHKAAIAQLDRFRREWDKYLRGDLVVKKDTEVTDSDLKTMSLVLFGDPGSNALIARALPKLPIRWTKDELDFDGSKYDTALHLPVLIQPSPFAKDRYIVLNSGHTFHEADFNGTNALLYPRLGDYAVVKPTPTAKDPAAFEVITAGLFDESWQFAKK